MLTLFLPRIFMVFIIGQLSLSALASGFSIKKVNECLDFRRV